MCRPARGAQGVQLFRPGIPLSAQPRSWPSAPTTCCPGNIVGTLDLLFTLGVSTFRIVDVNLTPPVATAAGEGGRAIYGSIDPATGDTESSRISPELLGVYQISNGSGDRAYSVTAQLGKRFLDGTELSLAYTYTERQGQGEQRRGSRHHQCRSTPVDGTLEHRELRTSLWGAPHKVTLVATTNLPLGLRLGLTYTAFAGPPYTYVLQGDPNADFFSPEEGVSNDVVYVPKDAGDISLENPAQFAALDRLIQSEPCLRAHRGRLLERNSCRNPWVHDTQARLAKRFRLAARRELELTADLFNVLNFIDSDWGLIRETVGTEGRVVPLLQLLRYDESRARGIYRVLPVFRHADMGVRWRLQLGGTLLPVTADQLSGWSSASNGG